MAFINGSDVHTVHLTDDGIAIIRLTSFEDDSMPEKIYSCFDELKKAKGYILDVRGNSGGHGPCSGRTSTACRLMMRC